MVPFENPVSTMDAYPPEAYLDPKGGMIPSSEYGINKTYATAADKDEIQKRLAGRERKLGPVEVPLRLLRKGGTNVEPVTV